MIIFWWHFTLRAVLYFSSTIFTAHSYAEHCRSYSSSVCLCIRLSHAGIVSRRMNIGWWRFCWWWSGSGGIQGWSRRPTGFLQCFDTVGLVIWPVKIVPEMIYTVNRKKPKCLLIYSLQNLTDCDKIWYILFWVNLSYRSVNVFCLTRIVSLPYLVKLSIHVLQVNSSYNCEPENTPKCFCHIFYITRPILIKFGTCFPD